MNIDDLYRHTKLNNKTGCLEWQLSLYDDGYGQAKWNGKQQPAHRIVWMIANNVILKSDEYVCHTCDNRKCIKLEHLFLGNALINSIDMINKGRGVYHYGEDHKNAKLNNEKVLEMRNKNKLGQSIRSLAKQYGVCFETAREAILGFTWKNIK